VWIGAIYPDGCKGRWDNGSIVLGCLVVQGKEVSSVPYAEVNDINMYYEESGSGPPLILLHWALGSVNDREGGWGGMMELFSARFRAIHLEHRGHGRTNNPKSFLTYEMIADDVCKFIEKLNLAPAHIGGVSDGAIVALHVGMTRPELVGALLCVGANYFNDELVVEANKLVTIETIEKNGRAEYQASLHDRNKFSGYWRELVQHLEKNLAVNPHYTFDDLSNISAPTLLMSGENDLWANPRQMVDMRKAIPNSEMLIINNAGHVVQHTHPQIIGPVVLDFLARHSGHEAG
jgi:pimeloyl-ACP methyl ester carboxylesterase